MRGRSLPSCSRPPSTRVPASEATLSATPAHRILVVEDDPEIAHLLSVILREDDREVVLVGTGAKAEAVLEEQAAALIVLDLILPDMDGRRLLKSIRESQATATTPVLVMMAGSSPETRQECYVLGADLVVEKPFDPDEFVVDTQALLTRTSTAVGSSQLDTRTGLLNRAGFVELFGRRSGTGALALILLDEFHDVTERWGWDLGSDLLREASKLLKDEAQERVLCRLGGGEFSIFSEAESQEDLASVSERMLHRLRHGSFKSPDGEALNLTASIGVVAVPEGVELEDALDGARRRVFLARQYGRNQVVSEDTAPEAGATRSRVLVAEDDEISATILMHRLEREGLDAVHYDSGSAAFEAALAETPDLVILDVKMPGMDGFEVLERLRRTPAYLSIPIIMLTSMGSEADVVRGFRLGADDYILKPFSPTELSARVRRLLRRGRSSTAL